MALSSPPPSTRDVTRAGAQLDRIRSDHVRLEEVALIEASLVNASFRSATISLSEFDRSLATGATHCRRSGRTPPTCTRETLSHAERPALGPARPYITPSCSATTSSGRPMHTRR